MPELPEVEFAMQQLRRALVGRTIMRVSVMHPALKRSLPPAAQKRLVDRTAVRVERRAKLQLVTFDDGSVLEVHFRMTGDWSFGMVGDDPEPRERARFDLDDGTRISLIDGRAFAVMRLHAPGTYELPPLGLEPLSPDFTADVLRSALAKKRIPIKQALLDQQVVAGLGNIYAAEALWEARISPETPANAVSARQTAELVTAIRAVLERAPAGRYYLDGTSDEAAAGDVAWHVYDREGQPCARCGTPIRRIVQGGRSTYFCPRCQRA